MIRPLKSKDLKNFIYYCQKRDSYGDFYITKDNKRYFLTDATVAKQVFNECMKWNNKCYVKEDCGEIKAVLLVVGYKDKSERKYIKVLSDNQTDFQDLINYLSWQKLNALFIKVNIKNRHFIKFNVKTKAYKPAYILRKNGFEIIKVREDKNEVLLKKEDKPYGTYKHSSKYNVNRKRADSRYIKD